MAAVQNFAANINLIESSSSSKLAQEFDCGTLYSFARGLHLAGACAFSLHGSAVYECITGAFSNPRGVVGVEDSSCICSHKNSLFTSLGNSRGIKFRGSLYCAKLASAGRERKLLKRERERGGKGRGGEGRGWRERSQGWNVKRKTKV